VSCPACGHENPGHAKFCGECGAALALRCAGCGTELPPNTKFCLECGRGVGDRMGPAGGGPDSRDSRVSRKVVTIVFADLVGSTALHERLDAEAVRQFMERYYAAMRGAVEAHGGRLTQVMGDGVKAVFGAPRVAEDDAIRAVRAGVEMQRAFRALAEEQRERVGKTGLRVAVNTGEVVADDAAEIIGDPVNVAARLQEQGTDGDVVIGGATQRIVASLVTLERLGSFALKGRSEAVEAYRVVSLERPAGAAVTSFVGRDEELARLGAVYDAATSAPAARLAVLLGSPGLGKSRLLSEFAGQLEGRARVLTAQCSPAGGATFAPLAEALRAHFQLETGEALRAALDALVAAGDAAEHSAIAIGMDALLTGTPALPEEIFFVVRRLLSALAAEQPVVLVIDDLQWAEPLLLDFTEHLVQWGAGVPLLVLGAARPELRDKRSSFTTPGGLVSDVVTLGGLDAGAAMRLAAGVIGADTLPAAVAGRVLTTSEGNPLFLGELVRMLVNDGALQRDGERWTLAVDVAALEMPPTIQALLAARIERLRPEERLVLERAAVVGRQFSRAAVTHLLPHEAHAELDARLEALRRSELIEADAGWLLGEPALRFHHLLIRDAAYRRVLRGTRAELHARFADWLEARAGESVELEETIGRHLEEAHLHLRELGPLDVNGRALGERAGRRLAAAGRRALARDDLTPAGSLLGRALDCLDAADPARGDLALNWCEALLAAGDVGTAARALAELGRFAAGSERLGAWHTCFTSQLAALADPKALRASAEAVVAAAGALAAAGDVAGEAKAHAVHAEALARLGEIGACEAALDKALAAARRANDRRRANTVLSGAPLAALWGPSPVTRASGRCLDVVRVLRITQGAPAVEAVALRCQAVLETLRGRSEAARRMIASSRRLVEELGITQRLLEVDHSAGLIELFEGDAVAAERLLRPAYEGFRTHGLGVAAAQTAALLGRALLAQGRLSEAEALSHESEALAGDDFQAAIDWRGTRALALAGRGEHATALELARAAVEIAAGTDDLLDHAAARSALAVALRAAGRGHEAGAEEARAIELWEQKGATLLAERARGGAARVAPAERAPEARVEEPRIERRRVRPNGGTVHADRLNAAIAARDAEVIPALTSAGFEAVMHPTGAILDRRETLDWWRLFFEEDRGGGFRLEPLGTLGSSLALCRQSWTGTASTGPDFEVGAYQRDGFCVIEADAQGRIERSEVFAPDRLGDAIARLYERYAEGLPAGPERTRAAATARSVALVPRAFPSDLDALAAVLAPDVEFVDHRPLGLPSRRGAQEFLAHQGTLFELANDLAVSIDDVVALGPDALLGRWINSGRLRVGGGDFEREFLFLDVYGADGLLRRRELLGTDRVGEALARFDELTAGPMVARPVPPRVRPNAAVANVRRFEAALAARDTDAFEELLAEDAVMVEHPMGGEFDRTQLLRVWHTFLAAEDLAVAYEPLATLGDSLALCRQSLSASGVTRGGFDVGPYEREELVLVDVDAASRRRRTETFALRSLGDAIARLYERFAEGLPEGPERDRAAATARSVAALLREPPYDWPFAPDVEARDHRTVGFGSLTGADAVVRSIHTLRELSGDFDNRMDDVLDLRSDALLVRWTTSGTIRASGGAYERPLCELFVLGVDGLLTRWEQFDAEQEAEALARFDELCAGPTVALPVQPRVRPNAAVANVRRFEAALAARDMAGFEELLAEDALMVEHATGSEFDRTQLLRVWRRFLAPEDLVVTYEPFATLGDSLALFRTTLSARGVTRGGFDVGPYEREELVLVEVDATGRRRRLETFALRSFGDAIARLYERYAELLPDGPERTLAAASARLVAIWDGPLDPDRHAAALAPSVKFVDHRTLGPFEAARGPEALVAQLRSWSGVAADVTRRAEAVLALRADALLARWSHAGIDRTSGGAYEVPFLLLWTLGADGLATHWETFDPEREAEALARFDELAGEAQGSPFENAAWRAVQKFERSWRERDWDGVLATYDPRHQMDDRRKLMRLQVSGEDFFANERMLFEETVSGWRSELLATRGDRLALTRVHFTAEASGSGPMAVEMLDLVEVDAAGRRVALVVFDADDIDAAYAELDVRYGDTKAPIVLVRRINARDWGGVAALFPPDLVIEDHRRLGWETMHGPAAYIASPQALVDLAPDARLRFDHLEVSGRGALGITTLSGSREGGAFEGSRVVAAELDADGLGRRFDFYGLEQLGEARAHFDSLAGSAPRDPLAALVRPNAATATLDRLQAAFEARDWAALGALSAEGSAFEDRRAHALVSGDADWALAYLTVAGADIEAPHFERTRIATAGDGICLERVLWAGGPAGGRVEVEYLWLAEVDEAGRLVAGVMFDADESRAAIREASTRWFARDAAAAAIVGPMLDQLEGWNDRDRARIRAVLADEFGRDDRRLVGPGRVDGADAYLDQAVVLWDLAPDSQVEPRCVLALEPHGAVAVSRTFGTLSEGGAFERYVLHVWTVARGRITRLEHFEIDQLDAALARLAELRPDPLRIPPNAATRARDRFVGFIEKQDWEALRGLCAPIRWEDRRRLIRTTGECDTVVANSMLLARAGTRFSRTPLATAGERLLLERLRVTGPADGLDFETDVLDLVEVDADGRLIALITFDPDDRRAASRELLERWAKSEAAQGLPVEVRRAVLDRDLDRLRAVLPAGFVFHDHRRTGAGRLEGADAYIAWIATLLERSPDAIMEALYYVAIEPHAFLSVYHNFGTLEDGGAFEAVFVVVAGPCVTEVYEPEDLELARARFEALRPDPTRIPPNAASRAAERISEVHGARDWEALRALTAPDFSFDDRQKRALVTGGVELWIQNLEFVSHPGRTTRELIGTAGNRVAIQHVAFAGDSEGGAFEAELLVLTEVAADGRLRARISFDPEDRAAAFAEAQARFVAGEAAAIGGHAPLLALGVALESGDWQAVRGCLGPGAVVHDHRLGLGEFGGDQWVEALRVQRELAPDVHAETLHVLAWNRHGRAYVVRRFGTLREGGPFENFFLVLGLTEGDHVPRYEIFDVADADRAIARFAELCAARE
jgi:class 3 adenylate cyclase/ketosteroid isomerase-like protein